MKNKIIIILLAVTLLIGVMAIPSFAGEEYLPEWNGTDLTGTTWVLPANWTCSKNQGTFTINGTVRGIVNGTSNISTHSFSTFALGRGNGISVDNRITVIGGYSSELIDSREYTLTFNGGTDVNNLNLINWLINTASITSHTYNPVCDGSTCPATDVNLDNVCDDCGMTFSMLREFTPSDFPSGYPSVPSVASDARYYLYRVHSSGSTYIVVYPSTVTPTYDTTKQNGYLTFSESYGSYRLDTANNEWVLNNDDSPYSIGGTNNNSVDILYSSVPIKDENGENFFPIPLWEKVEKVTQGEIPTFNSRLGGNLTILTLCGVGLITLLMALYLLSKMFKRYLP